MELAVVVLFVFTVVSLVRSCQSGPTQMELFDRLAMMRSDMQAVINDGGQVVDYYNNNKTTYARDHLLLTIDKRSWTLELQSAYSKTLLMRGWKKVKGDAGNLSFCKRGASAEIAAPTATGGGYVDMEFDANSISQCREALAADAASAVGR